TPPAASWLASTAASAASEACSAACSACSAACSIEGSVDASSGGGLTTTTSDTSVGSHAGGALHQGTRPRSIRPATGPPSTPTFRTVESHGHVPNGSAGSYHPPAGSAGSSAIAVSGRGGAAGAATGALDEERVVIRSPPVNARGDARLANRR